MKILFILILFMSVLFSNNLTSEEREEAELGKKAFETILKKSKISNDTTTLNRIKKVGMKIAKVTGKDYDWEFALVKDKSLNAFCLPGGKIVFYTGIFKVIKNDDQLATVMSHEISHALLRHGTTRQRLDIILSIPKELGKEMFKDIIPEELHGVMETVYDLGKEFTALRPFGREQESEADIEGIKLMYKAGFDIDEAVKFWRNMQSYGDDIPDFLSTHPSNEKRIKAIREEIRQLKLRGNK